jgi:5-methylcytosine-specific restriction endonuclease McrA
MILDYIELPVSKKDFTISKINGIDYNANIGNFSKHLDKNGYTIISYTIKFYSHLLPKCLETGEITDNKITGYWNRYIPLQKKYTELSFKVKMLENAVDRIKIDEPEYYTRYIDFKYWISTGIKLSESMHIISRFISGNRSTKLYRRLSESFYDSTWTTENKNKMINSILQGNNPVFYSKWTRKGIEQRGGQYSNECIEYYKNRPTVFRDVLVQKRNSERRAAKYNQTERRIFSVRCIEYWLSRGYNHDEAVLRVQEIQKNNTIDSIKRRYNCTEQEALNIQTEIYNRRSDTFSLKSAAEISDINRRKDSGSFEYCLRKCNFDESSAKKLFMELKQKRCIPLGRASKESLRYFIPLYKYLRNNGIDKSDIYWGISGSNEYWLRDVNNNLFFMYDFTILSHKLIIEYDGIRWHNDKEKDDIKEQLAINNGFSIFRIKSEWSEKEKFDYINKILNEKIQIIDPNRGVI